MWITQDRFENRLKNMRNETKFQFQSTILRQSTGRGDCLEGLLLLGVILPVIYIHYIHYNTLTHVVS